MPDGSEPLAYHRLCLVDDRQGAGSSQRPSEFVRCSIRERRVGALLVIVAAPAFELFSRVAEAEKDFAIQAFIAEAPIEAFDVAVLHGTARPDEIEFDP